MEKPALLGGKPIRNIPYPQWPQVDERDVEALAEVVRSGKWWMYAYKKDPAAGTSSSGISRVEVLEDKFRDMHSVKHAIAVSNGTVALDIACKAIGLDPGDEVITTPYTFVATSSCVLSAYALPVYVDILPENLTINPGLIESAITDRTRAIIPVHFGGAFCDMDSIREIAKKHNLWVIEDSAHMPGSSLKIGRYAGTLGDIGIFSFQNSKNLTCGEGGMIVTNNDELAEIAWSLRHMGRAKHGGWYETERVGTNSRLTELQAALLLSQLEKFPAQNETRRKNGRLLFERLKDLPGIYPPLYHPETENDIYYLVALRYRKVEWDGTPRDTLIKAVKAEGIPVSGGYEYPLYKNPLFHTIDFNNRYSPYIMGRTNPVANYDLYEKTCPEAEYACKEGTIWLSNELLLGTEEDTMDIVRAFEKVYRYRDQIRYA